MSTCSCQPEHRIVYERCHEAVCSCGSVLSIYGLTRTIASVFAEHLRTSVIPPGSPTAAPEATS